MNWIQKIACALFKIDSIQIVEKEVYKVEYRDLPTISPTLNLEVKEVIKEVVVEKPIIRDVVREVVVEKGLSIEELEALLKDFNNNLSLIFQEIDKNTYVKEVKVESKEYIDKVVKENVYLYNNYENPLQAVCGYLCNNIDSFDEITIKAFSLKVNELSTLIHNYSLLNDKYGKDLLLKTLDSWKQGLPTPEEYKAKYR